MKRSSLVCALFLPVVLCLAASLPAWAGEVPSGKAVRVAAAEEFIKLTLPDGSAGRLQPNTVIRIRRTIASESEHGAKTRIDWIQTMLVRESPEDVVALIGTALPSLGKLLLPDRSPIWFNALSAFGPLPLPDSKLQDGVLSGMALGSKYQFLASTPQQVHDEIAAKGGNSLPVPAPGGPRALIAPMAEWDADITQ